MKGFFRGGGGEEFENGGWVGAVMVYTEPERKVSKGGGAATRSGGRGEEGDTIYRRRGLGGSDGVGGKEG